MVRRLILNADDYGLSAEINAAVEELIAAGRLRDVSVLANGDLWAASARFLRRHPHLSAGAHLNAVEGRPVRTLGDLAAAVERAGINGSVELTILRDGQRMAVRVTVVDVSGR